MENNEQNELNAQIQPSCLGGVMRSIVWNPTMMLRWVDAKKANNSNNAVPFSNDIGWGHPSNVVLQQMWQGDMGEQKWEDIEVVG